MDYGMYTPIYDHLQLVKGLNRKLNGRFVVGKTLANHTNHVGGFCPTPKNDGLKSGDLCLSFIMLVLMLYIKMIPWVNPYLEDQSTYHHASWLITFNNYRL